MRDTVLAPSRPSPSRPRSLHASGSPRGTWRSLLRLAGYLGPHKKLVAACYLAWFVATGLDALIPLTLARAVDQGIGVGSEEVLISAIAAMVALYVVKAGANYVFSYLFHYYEAAAGRDIRNSIYAALQRLSFGYFDRVETGQLISRSTSDVDAAQHFLGHGFSQLLSSLGTYVVILAVAVTLSWQLTLLSLITMPFLIGIAAYFGSEVRPLFARVQQQHGVMTGVLQENLAGIRVVKSFANESGESAKFEQAARELLRGQIVMAKLIALRMPLMATLSGLGTILVVWYGGYLTIQGVVSIGTLIAFNYYLARLMGPARRLGWIINVLARAFASADRVFEVIDSVPDIKEKPAARNLTDVRGELRFEDVHFEFEPGQPVLEGIDLTVRAGEIVGLVGATGSGKSALASLVPRFYDATSGRVLVDGQDVRDLTLESLRRAVGVVQQDPFLFSRSLRENIAFGKPDSSGERVESAAERAEAHRFAVRLPDGYETVVGDRGLSLSGGQRQRTTLARAILVESPILILDDAVSSVDVETERRIKESLRSLRGGKTTLIIAHRVSTVQDADRIVVLEAGRIVESGTHDELVARNALYAALYRQQAGIERTESVWPPGDDEGSAAVRPAPGSEE
jgi:ABC-type multidrug transport system fused ATPase/permease subunit